MSGNLTANYGSLVGRIGSEDPFYVGTDFDQEINTSGPLSLYYWDSNAEDNSGTISVTIRLERIETASDASAGPQIKFFLLSNQENSLSGEMPYGEVFVVHVEYDEPQDDDVKRLDLTWNDEMLSLDVTAGSDKHIYTSESLFLLSPDEEN